MYFKLNDNWNREGARGSFGVFVPPEPAGEFELLDSVEITTNLDTTTFSGLSLTADDEILLVGDFQSAAGIQTRYTIYVNGNTTNTNYYSQAIQISGSSEVGFRENTPRFCYARTSGDQDGFAYADINLTEDGYFICRSYSSESLSTSTQLLFNRFVYSTFTVSSITSITISATSTNGLGAGSKIYLYKKGEV